MLIEENNHIKIMGPYGPLNLKGNKMKRKDYIKIAKVLYDYRKSNHKGNLEIFGVNAHDNCIFDIVLELCEMFKVDNRNFDKQAFIDTVYSNKN